jgi:hypothetical protein
VFLSRFPGFGGGIIFAVMMRLTLLTFAGALLVWGQPVSLPLANDKLDVEILQTGASIAGIVLKDDTGKMNPLWQPGRQAGRGHFLCVDGFGPVTKEEAAAGLRNHGEAVQQVFQVVVSGKDGKTSTLKLTAKLPLLQENVTRTYRVVDGEQVLYVETELESLTAFDRPISWGEHATIGAPFLEDVKTVVDTPAVRAQTRPYPANQGGNRRYPPGQNFTWPNAPLTDGTMADIRFAPAEHNSIGHTTQLMDPSRPWAWVTALHTDKHLLVGWVFSRTEFPWLQSWENYPAQRERMARGLEFSTQPYDLPRREVVDQATLFGVPTFQWLPAKSKITKRFLLFYTKTPEAFRKVDDVKFEKGRITIIDYKAAQTVTLDASLPL